MNTLLSCRNLSIKLEDGVATVCFDDPERKVNLLTQQMLDDIESCVNMLEALTDNGTIRGVIFCSAKSGVFIAGADINEIKIAQTLPYGDALAGSTRGQQLFERIARLPVVTVAAIDGRTLGGGLELALACDKIVSTSSKMTVFGLPETALQIVPGWGGTQRTGKKVGFCAALALVVLRPLMGMLNPRLMTWSAKQAYQAGLVDELVQAPAHLMPVAKKIALGGEVFSYQPGLVEKMKRKVGDSLLCRKLTLMLSSLDELLLGWMLPAQFAAIKLVEKSMNEPLFYGLPAEADTFARLVGGPACKKAVARFFAMQNKKKKSSKKD